MENYRNKYNIRENYGICLNRYKDIYEIKEGIVIYGEIYGEGIQKNYDYGLKEIEYAGFDVTINGNDCDMVAHVVLVLCIMIC